MGFGRTLAATMAHHGDNNGLVLPPLVAPKQVVIVPIPFKSKEEEIAKYSREIENILKKEKIRVELDDDNRLRPGEKFYKWEMFGIPVRIEIGPREAASKTVTLVRRDTSERKKIKQHELVKEVNILFEEIQSGLSAKSWERLKKELADAHSLEELRLYMDERKIVRVNWCGDPSCAFDIKDQVSGEIRGTLWDEKEELTCKCIVCGDSGKYIAYVSRTY
jgi:prolyl-tRNA synthetase